MDAKVEGHHRQDRGVQAVRWKHDDQWAWDLIMKHAVFDIDYMEQEFLIVSGCLDAGRDELTIKGMLRCDYVSPAKYGKFKEATK